MESKQCTKCRLNKPLSEFHNNKNSKDGKTYQCKHCAMKASSDYTKKNLKEIVEKKKIRRSNTVKSLMESSKSRAKANGIPFNLEESDIIVPDKCPILGIPLIKNSGVHSANSPSLDKIDPEKGYVKGNVQVISFKANAMKNNASKEELLLFAEWVNKTFKEENG